MQICRNYNLVEQEEVTQELVENRLSREQEKKGYVDVSLSGPH